MTNEQPKLHWTERKVNQKHVPNESRVFNNLQKKIITKRRFLNRHSISFKKCQNLI